MSNIPYSLIPRAPWISQMMQTALINPHEDLRKDQRQGKISKKKRRRTMNKADKGEAKSKERSGDPSAEGGGRRGISEALKLKSI